MGAQRQIDQRSDVYGLGVILYQTLTGRPPYSGLDLHSVLGRVMVGQHEPLEAGPGTPASGIDELLAACDQAMSHRRDQRHANAGLLGDDLEAWLDGARRRDAALAVVARAEDAVGQAAGLRLRVDALRKEAQVLLQDVAPWADERQKEAGWAKEDEAVALEGRALMMTLEREQLLQGALTHAPDLVEAHAALAVTFLKAHRAAEDTGDTDRLARAEAGVRMHQAGLPATHTVRQRCADYLQGDGSVTLVTDPAGAEVRLYRFQIAHRRLVPVYVRSLGHTPIQAVTLPLGRWLLEVRSEGMAVLRYPVHIRRGTHWDGIAPGDDAPTVVRLLPSEALGENDCHVPPGWFRAGGDPVLSDECFAASQVWCDGFVMQRFQVTNREYIAFLDEFVSEGREEDAMRWAPRERGLADGLAGALSFGRTPEGGFVLVPDAEGDVWLPDWPVLQVDRAGAVAYAAWFAAKTELPWRLPYELEWEKAARGVDGRAYPWGDVCDPSWACIRLSHSHASVPSVVDSFPRDVSVYGVRGLGGNAYDWCGDAFRTDATGLDGSRVNQDPTEATDSDDSARYPGRGGYWSCGNDRARSAYRFSLRPSVRLPALSFRLVRPV